jgi:dolichol-phosphate mannosyltransferase
LHNAPLYDIMRLNHTREQQGYSVSRLLSIVIPTYNESENIVPLVRQIAAALKGYDYEVVFVDDNSADGTAETIERLSAGYPVRVIVRKDEKGLASAVVHGINNSTSEYVLVMDADLQHPPEVIPALIEKARSGVDVVIASRYVQGGGCQDWGLIRRIISRGALGLAHLFLPATRPVNDPMSGFFMFNRRVVDGIVLKPAGYKILLEVLMEGNIESVTEVPFTFVNRSGGESKLNARQQIEYLKHLYSLMRRTGELVRFLKFCLVGLSGVLVNLGILWILTEFGGLPYQASAVISIEASIISNFILNDYFTFPQRRIPGIRHFFNRLWKFNVVSLAGAAINYGILMLFTEVAGVYYIVSQLIGIIVATLWNYLVNTSWTWR